MVRCALLRGRCDKVFLGQEDLGQEDFGSLLVPGLPEFYFPVRNLPV